MVLTSQMFALGMNGALLMEADITDRLIHGAMAEKVAEVLERRDKNLSILIRNEISKLF